MSGDTASPHQRISALSPASAEVFLNAFSQSGRFVLQRLGEDLKTYQAFLGCRTPAEVMQVQARYYRTAFEQYSAEASRNLGLMSGAMNGILSSSKSVFARSYDDVPL
ncbi:phasin family protein [Ovoidimarina sediminis]|uniref:phasin family protein n=1 Tax=Ovoidimarina sediminis TaxID=3079856 RepID=UPI0039772E0E